MRVIFLLLVAVLTLAVSGCGPSAAAGGAKGTRPATVTMYPKEANLATVTLTPAAEERLGITTVPVTEQSLPRLKTLGGEVMFPPGHEIIVSAPVSGTLAAPGDGAAPVPGQQLQKDQVVFSMTPLLSADGTTQLTTTRIEAEGAVEKAQVSVEAAKLALDRAEQLVRDEAGSQRSVDEAKAEFLRTQATRKSAQASRDFLARLEPGGLGPQLPIRSPRAGQLRAVHALPGQLVAAGQPLFEVAALPAPPTRSPPRLPPTRRRIRLIFTMQSTTGT